VVIFLDVPALTRYERHLTRMGLERALFTFTDFTDLETHPIERGTEDLRSTADELIQVTAESVAVVANDIEQRLRRRGIL